MGLLTKDQIFKAKDIKTETVHVPEWNGDVIIKSASAADKEAYDNSVVGTTFDEAGKAITTTNFENSKARFVVKCVVDEKGGRIFSDEDAKELGTHSAVVIDRLLDRIKELSGMTAKAQKAIEKNSDGTPKGGSHSS